MNIPSSPIKFMAYALRKHWRWVAFAQVLAIISASVAIFVPYVLKVFIDTVNQMGDVNDEARVFTALAVPLALLVGMKFLEGAAMLSASYIQRATLPRIRTGARHELFAHLMRHSHRFFMENFAGKLSHKVSEASMSMIRMLRTITRMFIPRFVGLVISCVILGTVNIWFGLIFAVWVALYLTMIVRMASHMRIYSHKASDAATTVTGKIVDAVTNNANVRMFARFGYEEGFLQDYVEKEVRGIQRTWGYGLKIGWTEVTLAVFLVAALAIGVVQAWQWGVISVGDVALVLMLTFTIMNQMWEISGQFIEFFEEFGKFSEGLSLVTAPHELVDAEDAYELEVKRGKIHFDKVEFKYAQGKDVFNRLNVVVKPSEKVGLVGFSGAGKSTFVHLMLRMFDVQGGAVKIDGQDISEVTMESLHRQIAMIPQDPSLFHRSLMENVRYGRLDASDEEVIEAVKKAKAHEFVEQLPEGYESLVGERGIKLSGGQRQRIALARAILKDAPILVLDEATSSLDSVTEKDIQDSLDELMADKTVIVVAHRLSTIAHLDRILVFDDGEVIEDGSHDELLAKGGHYARLWNMQAGGFLPEKDDSAA